ncbi:hypothetical protein [Streptomyces sp. NPDC047725]|uniref:hypothetical protein n=1 Tax=Streptomyces sp. NPDC047725 TaxID=3365487 RepID=UPI0037236D4B
MSTEARRASHPSSPPRPTTPPRPATPPQPRTPSAAPTAEPMPRAAGQDADASPRPSTAGEPAPAGAPSPGSAPPGRVGPLGAGSAPPPPRATARFPDAPPTVGRAVAASGRRGGPAAPGAPAESPSETTTRLRPVPAQAGPGTGRGPVPATGEAHAPRPATDRDAAARRPTVSFGRPEGYDEHARPRPLGGRLRPQAVAAAVCLVLGAGLVTGAVTGSWLAGDSADAEARSAFTTAGDLWHSVPVDQLFPPVVQGRGAGPGGADRTWTRVAVAPDSGCAGAFDRLLAEVLAPAGCERLLRATYTDATQSHVTTVGLLFTKADPAAATALAGRFEKEGLARRADLVPLPYAARDTVAAGFGTRQRAAWTVSVLTDAPVVVYAVSGWADGRTVDRPEPAEEAMESGATSAAAQAGLGHEAQGLADRVERALRKNVGPTRGEPS